MPSWCRTLQLHIEKALSLHGGANAHCSWLYHISPLVHPSTKQLNRTYLPSFTTMADVETPTIPQVLWAQQKYRTGQFGQFDNPLANLTCKFTTNFTWQSIFLKLHSTSKCVITDTSISFKAYTKECVFECGISGWHYGLTSVFARWPREDKECRYAFELDFYAEVIPEARGSMLYLRFVVLIGTPWYRCWKCT